MEELDSVLAILVYILKATVTLIINVKKVLGVEKTIVMIHLDLIHTQIVVMMQLLDQKIFAQLMSLVNLMKETVILMTNAKAICFVDQIIVLLYLDFHLQLTAVKQKVIRYLK